MAASLKSILAGAISGVVASYLAMPAIAATAAIAMPPEWPVALWTALVVFGLGAFLPALIIQFAVLLITRASALIALTSFCIASISTVAMLAGLTYTGSALAALILGSIAATAISSALWSNNSFKPTPLRGAA